MAKDTTTMTLSVPDGTAGVITTGPFSAADLRAAFDTVRRAPPMRETAADRAVKDTTYGIAANELRSFIERFERLELEKKEIADQQKEVMAEAKGRGYDTKILRSIIALRKREPDDIAEEEALLDMYKSALGMA